MSHTAHVQGDGVDRSACCPAAAPCSRHDQDPQPHTRCDDPPRCQGRAGGAHGRFSRGTHPWPGCEVSPAGVPGTASITRSRRPPFQRRRRSGTRRQGLTRLVTGAIRHRRACRAWVASFFSRVSASPRGCFLGMRISWGQNIRPVCRTDVRGEQRCLSLSHLWRLTAARVFDKLVRIFLATSDEKSKPLPVVLFLGVYSDGYE